jgi:hypothetical protein
LPFIIVVTYMTQQAARSRRPELSGSDKASRGMSNEAVPQTDEL